MGPKEKVGLIILWYMLKLVKPFEHNFEIDRLKKDVWAAMNGEAPNAD